MGSDLEITKACALAMGYRISDETQFEQSGLWCYLPAQHGVWYRPLSGDIYGNAQTMALQIKFKLDTKFYADESAWGAFFNSESNAIGCYRYKDLCRAICECVAKIERP